MSVRPASASARTCVLTPEGRGAIAVVRVWGPGAVEVADRVFRPRWGGSLAASGPGRLRLGRVGEGLGDEVVAVVVDGADPEVEIDCHGGPAAVGLVIAALEAAGAERRQPVAWVRHASRSAIAAEAEVDLVRAPTVRTAEVLLEQAQNALEDEVRRCLDGLGGDPKPVRDAVETLIRRAEVGLRLVSGWRVALAGRPNVGKSRLLNALSGFDRVIVDPTPGTTRDVVTVRIALDGWPVELSDTAGLRPSDDPVEASGIARARARHAEAELVVLVLDRSEPLGDADLALMALHSGSLVVANKCDLPAAWEREDPAIVPVSAERGDGIEALGTAIAARLVPDPPPPRAGVPFRPGQVRHLTSARQALEAGDLTTAEAHLGALLARLPGSPELSAPHTEA